MSTKFPPLATNQVVDLKKFGSSDDGLRALIAHLEAITAPAHSAEDHSFTDPENRGVCTICGWVHPDVPATCREHTVVDHIKTFIEQVQNICNGTGPDVIEITVVMVPIGRPKPPSWPFA